MMRVLPWVPVGVVVMLVSTLSLLAHSESSVNVPFEDTVFQLLPEESDFTEAEVKEWFEEEALPESFTVCVWLRPFFAHTTTSLFAIYDQATMVIVKVIRFNGSNVEIRRTFQYLFTIYCTYDFHTFPFDTQECQVEVKLETTQGCSPVWNTDEGKVRVLSYVSTLSKYTIYPVRYSLDPDPGKIILKVLFARKFEAYLLTTFLPCILLCLLAQVTLCFQLGNFTDRITVTLSLLIVLASLFSQMSSSLPSAPISKLLDYFFFYCIVRVSIIFLLHSLIERILRVTQDAARQETSSSVIQQNDLAFNVSMKLAWMSEEKDKKPPKAWTNVAVWVNRCGCVAVIVIDVMVAATLCYVAINDHYNKLTRFRASNLTQEPQEFNTGG